MRTSRIFVIELKCVLKAVENHLRYLEKVEYERSRAFKKYILNLSI